MDTGWPRVSALGRLLPSGIACAEAYGDVVDEPLHPLEIAYLHRAVWRRRAEFTTVRACARAALAQLGLSRSPMIPGNDGEPAWPPYVVGALTHCQGYRAAAVAPTHRARSLGIDAELHVPLPKGVLARIASATEQQHLGELDHRYPDILWETVFFSAKESVYKAWFPLARRWLGFDEANLVVDPERGVFTASLLMTPALADAAPGRFYGRWTVKGDHVLTAVHVPTPA